jgi:hypothetical protein
MIKTRTMKPNKRGVSPQHPYADLPVAETLPDGSVHGKCFTTGKRSTVIAAYDYARRNRPLRYRVFTDQNKKSLWHIFRVS